MYNTYKSLSDNLKENEIVFAITVEQVQMIAESMNRELLNYNEVHSVKKGIEWGLDFWGDIVRTAIDNLPLRSEEKELEDIELNDE